MNKLEIVRQYKQYIKLEKEYIKDNNNSFVEIFDNLVYQKIKYYYIDLNTYIILFSYDFDTNNIILTKITKTKEIHIDIEGFDIEDFSKLPEYIKNFYFKFYKYYNKKLTFYNYELYQNNKNSEFTDIVSIEYIIYHDYMVFNFYDNYKDDNKYIDIIKDYFFKVLGINLYNINIEYIEYTGYSSKEIKTLKIKKNLFDFRKSIDIKDIDNFKVVYREMLENFYFLSNEDLLSEEIEYYIEDTKKGDYIYQLYLYCKFRDNFESNYHFESIYNFINKYNINVSIIQDLEYNLKDIIEYCIKQN